MAKQTPMMAQYRAIKAEHPDTILFFRLGDFYEMFSEDALLASRILEIALTSREAGPEGRVPMCGVPYHAANAYIAKLIAKNHKVAICEQVEDPKLAKGLVKREVIRIITPGTVLEESMLSEKSANYLMAIWPGGAGFGLAYTDISTGEFLVTEILDGDIRQKLADEIGRISPTECLLPASLATDDFFRLRFGDDDAPALTRLSNEDFIKRNAEALLLVHFKVASLGALGLADMPLAVNAAAAVLQFLTETQKQQLSYINHLQVYQSSMHLVIDSSTRQNLELLHTVKGAQRKGSLIWVLDETLTAPGARLLRNWIEKPLLESKTINLRLDGVAALLDSPVLAAQLRACLDRIYDIERLIGRIAYGSAGPRDLTALGASLAMLPEIFSILPRLDAEIFRSMFDRFDCLEDIAQLITDAIADDPPLTPREGDIIRPGYSEEVDHLRSLMNHGKDWMAQLEAAEKERTGIKSLKVGYNKVFGYYIEVTHANIDSIPDNYIRKQTLVNAERFITPELKQWENDILEASDKLYSLEYRLFCLLREEVAANASRIQQMAANIAQLDVLQSLAKVAGDNDYCRPLVDDSARIEIKNGRHPVVEKMLGFTGYVANDAVLDCQDEQLVLLTGPNMAGKSTYIRQVALIVLLAHIGSFVPAEAAHIGHIDRIFTRVGASDNLAAGQSTFMVEMCETSNILRNATKDSLVILDEIGRGTSTGDGLAIAWAVSEYMLEKVGAKTLFATHYHELMQLAEKYPQVRNLSVAVKEQGGDILFLHKIVEGGTDKSYGIQVAKLAGLPPEVLRRAGSILAELVSGAPVTALKDLPPMEAAPVEEAHPILAELGALNLMNMTPMEALLWLEKWQKKIKES